MTTGQAVLSRAWDVPALLAAEDRLERRRVDAGRVHAGTLRDVLELHTQHVAGGLPLSTVPQVALLLHCSELRAGRLLNEALLLASLPEALEALEWGLLTPEQSAVVLAQLMPLARPVQLSVWQRLLRRLRAENSSVLPPARLTELLRRWVIEAEPASAKERRKDGEDARRVDYRRRPDGLGDLSAYGFRPPELQAILSRIDVASQPFGSDDLRTADQRRFDAMRDLLMGRSDIAGGHCAAACGCRAGEAAPCGADVHVHVPFGGALRRTDEPAEVVGHGPIEPDQLQDLLLNRPRLTPVFVDPRGIPVAIGKPLPPPERGDPASVRAALLRLAAQPPPDALQPRHPYDHRVPHADSLPAALARSAAPTGRDARVLATAALGPAEGEHPPAAGPGPYKVTGRLRRFLFARSPRCEFPGCGARTVRCDAEHDLAWPAGPSCPCNLGPCCRRHHRVKQEGWMKARLAGSGVAWTSPTGRVWASAGQHQPPSPSSRALPPLPGPNPFDDLSPAELEQELWWLADCPDDPEGLELRAVDVEPEDGDRLGDLLLSGDTRWTLDLRDPYGWD